MTQAILNKQWYTEFVALWGDDADARKRASRLQTRVQRAMDVLDKTPIGEEVVFEGECPSGSTYEGYFTWDGSAEMREVIARKAYDICALCVRVKDVRHGIYLGEIKMWRPEPLKPVRRSHIPPFQAEDVAA